MFRSLTPVVRALLYTNFIVFGLHWLTGDRLFDQFALWPLNSASRGGAPFEPWQVLTYAFLHYTWLHLLSNMFALYMFGPDCELALGSRRFALYYLVCVLGAAAAQLLTASWLYPVPVPTIGASGGIFGILLLFGWLYPSRRILLLIPPIPMPAWLFVTLYSVLELVLGVFAFGTSVAHFAHLGGMAAGLVLVLAWRLRRLDV